MFSFDIDIALSILNVHRLGHKSLNMLMTLSGMSPSVNPKVDLGSILVGDYGDAYSCLKAKYEHSIQYVLFETEQGKLIGESEWSFFPNVLCLPPC